MNAVIELEQISKSFGSFVALDDVSLAIEPGVTGLLGPNGAGKSTLIKILLGLLRATSGTGRLLQWRLGDDARQIRTCVGYMPEDDCYLPGLSGVESVHITAQLAGFARLESLRRAHEILDYCGVGQERYRRVETYSTGMRQKLRFAQAIVHDPALLILDEPTSGLDSEEREIMLRRIRRLAQDQGKSILICTHILPDVQKVSDGVVILSQGRVRLADRMQNLSQPAQPAVNVRIWGPTEPFLEAMTRRGFSTTMLSSGAITVAGTNGEPAQAVWRVAAETGTVVRGLTPVRNSLEEVFLSAVKG